MKNIRRLLIVTLLFFMASTVFCPGQAYAASKNAAAHSAYSTKMKALMKNNSWIRDGIRYYYKDLNRDGSDEVIMLYHDYSKGSSDQFRIYTYKNGKAKLIGSEQIYGLAKIIYYKKTKSLVVWSAGHGNEVYRYFKYSKGKYKPAAIKCRISTKGGSWYNGSWQYYKGNFTSSITSAKFKKLVKTIRKGTASKNFYSYNKWKVCLN